MKNGFEIVSNDLQTGLRIWGKTLKDLFRNALAGIAFYLKPDIFELKKIGERVHEKIKTDAVDLNTLLVEFLSKTISHAEIRGAIFTEISFKKFGENFLEAEIRGVKTTDFERDIKAIPYHDVDIKKNPETWFYETTLMFDV